LNINQPFNHDSTKSFSLKIENGSAKNHEALMENIKNALIPMIIGNKRLPISDPHVNMYEIAITPLWIKNLMKSAILII
jgi:hypothetical protein